MLLIKICLSFLLYIISFFFLFYYSYVNNLEEIITEYFSADNYCLTALLDMNGFILQLSDKHSIVML